MLTDHSKTYQLNDLRNIAHIARLRAILRTLRSKVEVRPKSYADFGCSNGFVTNRIVEVFGISEAFGYDCSENVAVGSSLYPNISFHYLDLNIENCSLDRFDLVTCFETLEHVGNISVAVQNICRSRAFGGHMLISVPIEIGAIGLIKYLIKRLIFRYDLPLSCGDLRYFFALLSGVRISKFRKKEVGYGSHFGFDYRDVDDLLALYAGASVDSWNSGTTRFYLIRDNEI